ncbi:hypothetical protein R69927_01647 [Paraburkholderia domus]|jgi:hypothetical protein|uniref:Uncharacterized protein n=2 Tax=Paraburkholderia domus TaxID=2793075 RepID=A0A9N8MTZ0_9BURK|nr:hypothetical protein R75483_00113 [Paraburkholderia domus]CAE6700057.1 hypothetical protein R70006_00681 [Paraburkholderia domus]CAE6842394.1 hypothetical protein R69927_01647 [Paraburkholderia domus]CAE6876315.1 hypothetical protein R70199_02153 [Paraburkholderia domus]CAE6878380.1 hypothetical protein R69749_06877 [Paraburkholderia domus]
MIVLHYRNPKIDVRSHRSAASVAAIILLSGLLLLDLSAKCYAQDVIYDRTFDLASDTDFRDYEKAIAHFLLQHHTKTANDFCVLGVAGPGNLKQAWILWQQGRKIILWEGRGAELDLSPRMVDLDKDVVKSDSDLHGSTYLVTKAWVDKLTVKCDQFGTKLRFRKRDGTPDKIAPKQSG